MNDDSKQGFPIYTHSARKGETGVTLVAQIVSDIFGWIFKRNHQEYDFGIDGQIEIVSEEGAVTGQIIAVQIKYGKSFFQEKNRWGYVYRGENKHFNYLSNYPTPVIIIICHPKSKQCYWEIFIPEQTQRTKNGWKMTIPVKNQLLESKLQLLQIVGPVINKQSELEYYWMLNQVMIDSTFVVYVLDDIDIRASNISHARDFFNRLLKTKEIASATQGKIEFAFSGYDDDPQELWEIEKVRSYISILDKAIPEILFFICTSHEAQSAKLFMLCLCQGEWENERSTPDKHAKASFDIMLMGLFLEYHWPSLNEITDWLGMSEDENKAITFAFMRCVGLNPDDIGKVT